MILKRLTSLKFYTCRFSLSSWNVYLPNFTCDFPVPFLKDDGGQCNLRTNSIIIKSLKHWMQRMCLTCWRGTCSSTLHTARRGDPSLPAPRWACRWTAGHGPPAAPCPGSGRPPSTRNPPPCTPPEASSALCLPEISIKSKLHSQAILMQPNPYTTGS